MIFDGGGDAGSAMCIICIIRMVRCSFTEADVLWLRAAVHEEQLSEGEKI